MGSIGAPELILIFLVILLVFGAKRIPEIARGLGKGIREFRDATKDIKRELTVDDYSSNTNRIQAPRYGEPAARTQPPQQAPAEPPQQAPAPQADNAESHQPQ